MDEYSIGLQTVAYTGVASTAAFLFDFSVTFDSEVRWTWGRKWGIVRIAFVVSRYLPIVGVAMTVFYAVESTHGGIRNNGRFSAVYDAIHFVGAFAAEVLLVTRTIAFWGRKKIFLITISVFSMAIAAAMLTIAYVDASKFEDSTRGVLEEGKNTSIIYGLLTFYELVLLFLTLYQRSKGYRLESSPVVVTLYRDGVIYMLCIALVSMANCITVAVLPTSYTALLIGPQIVVHSVLASRILFNLRATNGSQDNVINGPVASGVVFAQPIQTRSHVDYIELRGIAHL